MNFAPPTKVGYRPDVIFYRPIMAGDRGLHRGYCTVCPVIAPEMEWSGVSRDEVEAMAVEHMRLYHGIEDPTSGY